MEKHRKVEAVTAAGQAPATSRRGFLGGAGLLLGGAAAAAAGSGPVAAATAAGGDGESTADAGALTEHRRTYYEKARF